MNNKIEELSFLINENKLRVISAIYKCTKDVCACNLVDNLGMPKNLLSYHIKTLREAGFIEEVKCGRFKNYCISKNKINRIKQILELVEML
jgi:DNA-binding transcriptional ArsR family regulator